MIFSHFKLLLCSTHGKVKSHLDLLRGSSGQVFGMSTFDEKGMDGAFGLILGFRCDVAPFRFQTLTLFHPRKDTISSH